MLCVCYKCVQLVQEQVKKPLVEPAGAVQLSEMKAGGSKPVPLNTKEVFPESLIFPLYKEHINSA